MSKLVPRTPANPPGELSNPPGGGVGIKTPYLPTAEWIRLTKLVEKRRASYEDMDRLVKDLTYWKQRALEWKFLLDRIWEDDPILKDQSTTNLDQRKAI